MKKIILLALLLVPNVQIVQSQQEESPADLMRRANEMPEECFSSRGTYGDMLEIMLVSGQREYYFLYEISEKELAVVIPPFGAVVGGAGDVTTIDEGADGSVEYGKDSLDLSRRALERKYHEALEALKKAMDTCSQPARVLVG